MRLPLSVFFGFFAILATARGVDTTPPVITAPADIQAVATTAPGVVVNFEVSAVDETDPAPLIIVNPPSGSVFVPGTTDVVIYARDATLNESIHVFSVTVTRTYAEISILAEAGMLNRQLIGSESSDDPYSRLMTIGVPTVTDSRRLFVTASARVPGGGTLRGIAVSRPLQAGPEFAMPLRVGSDAGWVAGGLTLKSFPREPFADYTDDGAVSHDSSTPPLVGVRFGFYARVAGPGVTAANDDVLAFFNGTVSPPLITSIARENDEAAGVPGGRFKSFTSAALAIQKVPPAPGGPTHAMAFTAMLRTGPSGSAGPGGVTRENDMGLWVWEEGMLTLALREGQMLGGRKVRSFEAMQGPAAHGHAFTANDHSYRNAAGHNGFTALAFVNFTDGTRWIAAVGRDGVKKMAQENTESLWLDTGVISPFGTKAPFGKFMGAASARNGFVTLLSGLTGQPVNANAGIFSEEDSDANGEFTIFKGDQLPDGSRLTTLAGPIINTDRRLAFTGKTNTGVSAAWHAPASTPMPLNEFFRVGGVAPGTGGASWLRLQAYALPDGVGPVFTGKLRIGGAVTAANDTGLWAVDPQGVTHLLIREGATIEGKTVRSFKALTRQAGSPGQSRSYNAKRGVIAWMQATDGTQRVLHFALP